MTSNIKVTNSKISKASSSRRKFLQDAALVTGGLAGILATGTAPATAQSRELKMLVNSHFVPASDAELERQMAEFGKAAGVKTRLDRVAHLQLPAVLAGEVQGQKGHDLVAVGNSNPHLYSKHLPLCTWYNYNFKDNKNNDCYNSGLYPVLHFPFIPFF